MQPPCMKHRSISHAAAVLSTLPGRRLQWRPRCCPRRRPSSPQTPSSYAAQRTPPAGRPRRRRAKHHAQGQAGGTYSPSLHPVLPGEHRLQLGRRRGQAGRGGLCFQSSLAMHGCLQAQAASAAAPAYIPPVAEEHVHAKQGERQGQLLGAGGCAPHQPQCSRLQQLERDPHGGEDPVRRRPAGLAQGAVPVGFEGGNQPLRSKHHRDGARQRPVGPAGGVGQGRGKWGRWGGGGWWGRAGRQFPQCARQTQCAIPQYSSIQLHCIRAGPRGCQESGEHLGSAASRPVPPLASSALAIVISGMLVRLTGDEAGRPPDAQMQERGRHDTADGCAQMHLICAGTVQFNWFRLTVGCSSTSGS